MPTNEERREVARKLRDTGNKLGQGALLWFHVAKVLGVRTSIGGKAACDMLADLIEPEPKRTCRRVWHKGKVRSSKATCSECGYGITDRRYIYCPNCGSKVVNE